MRIVGIESTIVEVPLKEPVTGVHGVTTVQKSVLVRVTSDDGGEGWGDVDPTPGYTLESVALADELGMRPLVAHWLERAETSALT